MEIIKMTKEHKQEVFEMMRVFYDSPALIHKSSDEILWKDIDACLSDWDLIQGYVFMEADQVAGYSMVSRNFTTEFGGLCIWIEDLYVKPEYRGRGIASEFFQSLKKLYPEAVRYKLEVESENEDAMAVYFKNEFELYGYSLMTREL